MGVDDGCGEFVGFVVDDGDVYLLIIVDMLLV